MPRQTVVFSYWAIGGSPPRSLHSPAVPYCIPPLPLRLRTGPERRERGYFLVELLAGLAVIAVLVTLAMPALQTLVRTHRVRTVAKDLAVEISWAQAEAVRRGSALAMRFQTPPGCVVPPAATTPHCGWDVFVDANGDGAMQAGDTVVRSYVSPSDMLLKADANPLFLDAAGNIRNKGGFGAVGLHVEVALIGARADDPSSHIVCFNAGGRIRVTTGQKCLS